MWKSLDRLSGFLPGGRLFLSNTGLLFVSGLVDRSAALLTSVFVTRALGATGLGIYTATMVAAVLGQRLAEVGIPTLLQRELAARPAQETESFNSAFTLRIITTLFMIAGLLIYGVAWAKTPIELLAILLSIGLASTQGLLLLFFSAFYARFLMRYQALLTLITRFVYLVLAASLYLRAAGLLAFMTAQVSLAVVQLAGAAWLFSRRLFPPHLHLDHRALWRFFKTSLSMGLSRFLVLAYDRVDVLFVAWLLPRFVVGYYGIAYNVFTSAMVFSNAYFNSTYTLMSQVAVAEPARFRLVFTRLLLGGLLIGITLGLGMWMLGGWLAQLLYGNEFRSVSPLIRILSLAVPFMFTNVLCQGALNALGRQLANAVVAMAAIVLNVGSNLVLIPHSNVMGAAIATVLTEAFILVAALAYLLWGVRSGSPNGPCIIRG